MHPELTQAGPAGMRRVMRVDGSPSEPGDARLAGVGRTSTGGDGHRFCTPGRRGISTWARSTPGRAWPPVSPLGPLGQVCGSWAPDLWPGRVAASRIATLFEGGGRPTAGFGALAGRPGRGCDRLDTGPAHDGGHGSTRRALGRAGAGSVAWA